MPTCAVKRGFFVLRDCGDPAPLACTTCGRPVCQVHIRYAEGTPVCIECQARSEQRAEERDDVESGRDDASWTSYAYGARHQYYTTGGYRPLDTGEADSYYDQYDVRAFDAPEGEPVETDDESDADFGAS